MVVYEITATVEPEHRQSYELFMADRHIPDVLATRLFTTASFESARPGRYRIRYIADTRELLDSYLASEAPRLRKDLLDRFPSGVELTREEWTVLRQFA